MNREQKLLWELNGFLTIERMLDGTMLRRLRDVFEHGLANNAQPPESATEGLAERHIADPLDCDPIFVELAEHPALLDVIDHAIGDDAIVNMYQAGTHPPGPRSRPVYWHSDIWHYVGFDLTRNCHFARAIIYLDDVEPGGGAFSYVAGSHRLDPYTLVHPPKYDNPLEMPNSVQLALPAGSAIVFNTYGWHARLPNTSTRTRRAVQIGYAHGWVTFLNRVMAPKNMQDVDGHPRRKQLFGLDNPNAMYSYGYVAEWIRRKQDALTQQ